MKSSVMMAMLLLVCASADAKAQNASATRSRDAAALETKVDAYVKPFVEIKAFSGSVLVARKGVALLRKSYGMANYELDVPNTPQTRFHIASISKGFTAAAIMILEERGLLAVSDTLDKYIPDYPNGQAITIHHLLVHTSGIPNVNGFPDYDDKSKFPQTLTGVIEMFKHRPLQTPPGQRYSYSNSNYNLLAFIIEKASGKSYGSFLKENIFDPLGMKDTGHDGGPAPLVRNRASGYVSAGLSDLENAPFLDWSIKTGNGSLYSTIDDLYKWDRALYIEKIFKRSTLDRIFTQGYGWIVTKRLNRSVIIDNGRSPGFQAEIQRYPDEDVCVIVMSNNYSGAASFLANGLAAMMFGEPYTALSASYRQKPDSLTADTYSGRYEAAPNFFIPGASINVQTQNGYLTAAWRTGPASQVISNSWLVPMGESRFYDRNFGGIVTFVKDANGKVSHLMFDIVGSQSRANKVENP